MMNQGETLTYPFPMQKPRAEFIPTTPTTTPNVQPEKRKQENLFCDTCGIEVNSPSMLETHLRGQKHLKKLKSKSTNSTISPMEIVTQPPIESNGTNSNNILQWINEIARFNKVTSKYDLISETGPDHSKHFEVRLTLGNELYLGTGTSIKRAQQSAAEQAFSKTIFVKPEHVLRQSNSNEKSTPKIIEQKIEDLNLFENNFEQKLREITEDAETIEKIHHVVENLEQALKSISDRMTSKCQMKNTPVISSTTNEDPLEMFRMLKGAMKISSLAMEIYLKANFQYDLVLICAAKPTRDLLKEIHQELILYFQQTTDGSYRVEMELQDLCLTVQSSLLPIHVIRIRLTSSSFSSDEIEMLTEIQRSSWFSEKASKDRRIRNILSLLFHLQNVRTPLNHLDRWSLVFLVHQCRNSSLKSLREYFRYVFICLSGGLFLPNCFENVALIDPCKNDLIDVTKDLTTEKRLEITRFAQKILRHFAFDQFDSIF